MDRPLKTDTSKVSAHEIGHAAASSAGQQDSPTSYLRDADIEAAGGLVSLKGNALKTVPRITLLRGVTQYFPEIKPEALQVVAALKFVTDGLMESFLLPLLDEGLSEGKFCLLLLLWLAEREAPNARVAPSEIAEQIGVTRATITGLLDGLERDDYIERHHQPHDRRAVSVGLTEKGRRRMSEFMPVRVMFHNWIADALTTEERQTLLGLLAKLGGETLQRLLAEIDGCIGRPEFDQKG